MMQGMPDISRQLISEEDIKFRLGSIFVDSIVLTTDFTIKVVSHNVLDVLEFSTEELSGKSINYLTHQTHLQTRLQKALRAGFFEDVQDRLFTKGNKPMQVKLSGFYLGLVSDLNGYIILKVHFEDRQEALRQEATSRTELDKFIYRTSHDLRGPLATIRGLVNLIKLRQDDSEIDTLVNMIDVHAQKLDDRLFQLFYLAGHDDASQTPRGCLHLETLVTNLRETLTHHPMRRSVQLHIGPCTNDEVWGVNEFLVMAVLNNLLLYLLGLSAEGEGTSVSIEFECGDEVLVVHVQASGFETNGQIRKAIRQPNFIYQDLLNHPMLVNYYAAKKMTDQLKGFLSINFLPERVQTLYLSIPRSAERQLALL